MRMFVRFRPGFETVERIKEVRWIHRWGLYITTEKYCTDGHILCAAKDMAVLTRFNAACEGTGKEKNRFGRKHICIRPKNFLWKVLSILTLCRYRVTEREIKVSKSAGPMIVAFSSNLRDVPDGERKRPARPPRTKAQRSGFGPERRSSEMSELSRLRESEGYGACFDEVSSG